MPPIQFDSAHASPASTLREDTCVLCSSTIKWKARPEITANMMQFAQLLNWAPGPLPMICPKCWERKHPKMAAEAKISNRVRNMIGENVRAWFVLAYIPTPENNGRIDEEMCARSWNLPKGAIRFERSNPEGWWRDLSFAYVAPLCVSLNRFNQFCRATNGMTPRLPSCFGTFPHGVKQQVLSGDHGSVGWCRPDGTTESQGGKALAQTSWASGAQQWNNLLADAIPSSLLSIDTTCAPVLPFTFMGFEKIDRTTRLRSQAAIGANVTSRIKMQDSHRPCYLETRGAPESLSWRASSKDLRANSLAPLHREVLLGTEFALAGDVTAGVSVDFTNGSVGEVAKLSSLGVGIQNKSKPRRRRKHQDKNKNNNNNKAATSSSGQPPQSSSPAAGGYTNHRLGKLSSFTLWLGGVLPLPAEHSPACYLRRIHNQATCASVPPHPPDCFCTHDECVLVGGFHIVKLRGIYNHPSHGIVAGFHANHTIGPQFAVSSAMSRPVSCIDVRLDDKFNLHLRKHGVISPPATDALNLPLLLLHLKRAGLPDSILGTTTQKAFKKEMESLLEWCRTFKVFLRTGTQLSSKYVLYSGIPDAVAAVPSGTFSGPDAMTLLSHNRSYSGWGVQYSTVACGVCARQMFFGFVETRQNLSCWRCDTRSMREVIGVSDAPRTPDSLPTLHHPAEAAQLNPDNLKDFADLGAMLITGVDRQSIDETCFPIAKQFLRSERLASTVKSISGQSCPLLFHCFNSGDLVNQQADLVGLLPCSGTGPWEVGLKLRSHQDFFTASTRFAKTLQPARMPGVKASRFANPSHDWCSGLTFFRNEPNSLLLIDSRCIVRLPSCKITVCIFSRHDSEPRPFSMDVGEDVPGDPHTNYHRIGGGVFQEPGPRLHLLTGPWHRTSYRMNRFFTTDMCYIVPIFRRPESEKEPPRKVSKNIRPPARIDQLRIKFQQQMDTATYNQEANQIRRSYTEATDALRPPLPPKRSQLESSSELEGGGKRQRLQSVPPNTAMSSSATVPNMEKRTVCTQNTHKHVTPTQHTNEDHVCKQRPDEDFVPCVPEVARFSRSCVLLMAKHFADNLIGSGPPKTQTLRVWTDKYAEMHMEAFRRRLWVRVWRGQGHACTIGWALYISFRKTRLGALDQKGCAREGRPTWSPQKLLRTFLHRDTVPATKELTSSSGRVYLAKSERPAVTDDTLAYEIRFVFRACLS